jgi:hypothetical protein
VRVAFVLGFFDPVLRELESQLSRELKFRSVVWIRQTKLGGPPDLTRFSSNLFDRLTQGATHVLVVVAVLSGKEWVEEKLKSMIAEAEGRFSVVSVELIFEKKAMASNFVIQKLKEFKCTVPEEVTRELLARKLGTSKVFCVREKHSTSFRRALERHGIPEDLFDDFFLEHAFEAAASSEGLEIRLRTFQHAFYAFDGFSHAFGNFLEGYSGKLFKESNAAGCTMSFKKWLLEQ